MWKLCEHVKLKVINDETMQKCKHDEMCTLCEHVINVSICKLTWWHYVYKYVLNVNMMIL